MKKSILIAASLLCCASLANASDYIAVIFDASGSMSWHMSNDRGVVKADIAKQAVKQALMGLPKDTQVGVIAFPTYSNDSIWNRKYEAQWAYPIGPVNQQQLEAAVDGISIGGGTPLGEWMKFAADALLEKRKADPSAMLRLVIATDGAADDTDRSTGRSALVDRYTTDILNRGIVIDTIGVDMPDEHQLAKRSHSYRNANNAADLLTAVQHAIHAEASTKKDTSGHEDDTLQTLALLPQDCSAPLLKSITKVQNQPIGEPPVDEVLASNPVTTSTPTMQPKHEGAKVAKEESHATRWFVLGTIVVVLIFIAFWSRRNQ